MKDPSAVRSSHDLDQRLVTRRAFLGWVGAVGIGVAGAACAPAAAPAPATPAAAPTTPPAVPTPTVAVKRAFTPATMKLAAAFTTAGHVPWRLGIKQGFFKEFGIELVPSFVQGSGNVIASLTSGEVTMGEGGVPAPLTSIEKGAPFRILAGAYVKPLYVFFSRPEIKSPKDLEGKAVGSDRPGSLTYAITQLVLRTAKVDLEKLQVVAIGSSPDIYRAVVAGKIQAGLGAITFLPSAQRDGVVPLIKVWEFLPNYVTACIYTTTDAIKNRRDEVVRTLAGFAKSYRFSREAQAKDLWIKTAQEELKEEPSQAEFEWQWMRENNGLAYDLVLTKEQIDYMQQINVDSGSQTKILPFEQVADMSLAKEALALLQG